MRAVLQRVSRAKVTVSGKVVGEIGRGIVVLLGIAADDSQSAVRYLAEKIVNLRIFEDGEGKMNLSVLDVGGCVLVVSQFTLYGDTRKGRRPSFVQAAKPDVANILYESFVAEIRKCGVVVESGQFQAMMDVELVNDGPVTLIIDTEKDF